MMKIMTSVAAVAAVAVATIAAPAPAEARNGGAIAAGVIGGLAAGAIIGGAAAAAPRYGYYGSPAYYDGGYYAAGPACGWRRERIWDGYGWVVRRVRVCY
jgi:hypothetical protein